MIVELDLSSEVNQLEVEYLVTQDEVKVFSVRLFLMDEEIDLVKSAPPQLMQKILDACEKHFEGKGGLSWYSKVMKEKKDEAQYRQGKEG